jgi:hypothetical protein
MIKPIAYILAVFLVCIAAVGCLPEDKAETRPRDFGFPVLEAIADADPSKRSPTPFLVPTRLWTERTDERISIAVDMNSLERIELQVGENMVTGLKDRMFVYRDGQLLTSDYAGLTGGTTANIGTTFLNRSLDNIPQPGEKYLIEIRLEIFETDIPAQHMWHPEGSDKYKVLWTRTLTQRVE